jgi:hypothetical protein
MSQIFNVNFENNMLFDPGINGTGFDVIHIEGGTAAVSATANYEGSYGLQITPRTSHMCYGAKNVPDCYMTKFRQSFWFDPNSISIGTGNYLCVARNGHADLDQMMYLLLLNWNGSSYCLSAGLADNDRYPTSWSSDFTITDAWHLVEMYWQRGTPGSLQWWIDGSDKGTLTETNDLCWVNAPCLGQGRFPSFSISGSYRFDKWRGNDDGSYIGGT